MSRAKTKKISGGEIVLLTAFIFFLMLFFLAYIYRPASKIVTKIVDAERSKTYKSMAVDYLREKYGMEAEAVDVLLDYPVPDASKVHMKCEDREFSVQINNRQVIRYISDDYQYEEIEKAFLDKIEESLPGGYNYRCTLYDSPKGSVLRYLAMSGMDDVFDGTNLDEIMKNKSGDITVLYVDTEFNDCEFFDWIQEYRINAIFVSFDSQESFNEVAGKKYTLTSDSSEYWLKEFGDHITDIREVKS